MTIFKLIKDIVFCLSLYFFIFTLFKKKSDLIDFHTHFFCCSLFVNINPKKEEKKSSGKIFRHHFKWVDNRYEIIMFLSVYLTTKTEIQKNKVNKILNKVNFIHISKVFLNNSLRINVFREAFLLVKLLVDILLLLLLYLMMWQTWSHVYIALLMLLMMMMMIMMMKHHWRRRGYQWRRGNRWWWRETSHFHRYVNIKLTHTWLTMLTKTSHTDTTDATIVCILFANFKIARVFIKKTCTEFS